MRNRICAACGVLLWIFGGTLFYFVIGNCISVSECAGDAPGIKEVCGWTWQQSFYYSIQAGLSIGFGLLAETKDESRLYTIFHVLAGASFIGGALSLFARSILEQSEAAVSEHERKIASFAFKVSADGYGGMDLDVVSDLMSKHPHYMQDLYCKLEEKKEAVDALMYVFKNSSRQRRKRLALEALKWASENLEAFKDKLVTIEELLNLHRAAQSPLKMLFNAVLRHRRTIVVFGFFLTWIAVGTLFYCLACGGSITTGAYFAVAALSTAGMQATCEALDGTGSHVILVALYCIVGVPVYGLALGTFANLLVVRRQEIQQLDIIEKGITSAERHFVQHLMEHHLGADVTAGEYMQIQLLRLGKVDPDTLRTLKEEFQKLDATGAGSISIDDAIRGHHEAKARAALAADALGTDIQAAKDIEVTDDEDGDGPQFVSL
eukprot:TRINITY_DN27653_c0_g1_i1.p1 TRINITY_DN27653_c0_g1~~TRINITY_DN27653_c0_g1_i1.p1  ORF type:complete len:435 (+),score=110.48 TRINITY_DN27653_c0_g1_i1:41-1345(+)